MEKPEYKPRFDLYMEQSLLGCWMSEPRGKIYILAPMDAMDFYYDEHTVIAKAIIDMVTAGEKIDFSTVAAKLKAHGDLDRIGGRIFLEGMVKNLPTLDNAVYYRDELLDFAYIRKMSLASYDALEMSTRDGPTSTQIEGRLMDGLVRPGRGEGAVSAFQLAMELMEAMEPGKAPPTPHSGMYGLDELLYGFQPASMYTIAARMSIGKTSLLSWIALQATYNKFPFLYVTMEMPRKMIGLRMIAAIGKVNLTKYIKWDMDDDELRRSLMAKQRLSELPLYFDANRKRTVDELILTLRREKIVHNIAVVGVDYLQLLHDSRPESRTVELDAISGKLKGIADELDICLIAVVTANRASIKENRGVGIGDVRGSDSIGYDADVAIVLDKNEERTDSNGNFMPEDVDKIDLKVVKNRNGKTGGIQVYFDKRYQLWLDNAPEV